MLRKLRIYITSQHALMLAYRAELYLWVLAHTLPFIMMSVWMTASSQPGGGGGFAMSSVDYARYYLTLYVVRLFTVIWLIYEFEWMVVEGRLSYLLLRPFNAVWHFVSAHLGEQVARLPFSVVIVTTFFLIYPHALWVPSAFSICAGILAIYCAFALRFTLQYAIANLTFWYERASSLEQLSMLPYLFLSGFVIPLGDFPPEIRAVVRFTPWPYMVDFPVRILMGRLTPADGELYTGLAIMAGWFLILLGPCVLLWKRGLRKYSGHGA